MYRDQHTSNAPYSSSLLNAVLDRVSCCTHWIVTLFSNNRSCVLQSVSQQCKTADVVEIHTRQRGTIEFLTTESTSPIAIHAQMKITYGEDTTDVNSDAGSVIL